MRTHAALMYACSGLASLILFGGCVVPGHYVINGTPTESPRAFKNVAVQQVQVGTLPDPVNETTPLELRNKLIEEIGKKRFTRT